MAHAMPIKGAHMPPKAVQSRMETIIVTPQMVNDWKIPPFQRPLRINSKVQSVTDHIRNTESIDGVLTLGTVKPDPAIYIVDGQHRCEAFKLSGLSEAIADVRVCSFRTISEMAEEFVQLNSSLVRMRPDDILRGLEGVVPVVGTIRRACEFVGFDQIRRGSSSPVVSMSALLRCWHASAFETPAGSNTMSAAGLAQALDEKSAQNLIAFLATAHAAWGRDPEYFRLWGNLNLTLCMWLWHKLVLDRDRFGSKRYAVLTIPQFKKCLMSVSADGDYISWLVGRNLGDRDRSPAYVKLKSIFSKRLREDGESKPMLPSPAWASK